MSTKKRLRTQSKKIKSATTKSRRKVDRATVWVSLCATIIIIPLLMISTTIILFQIFQLNLPGVYVFDKDVGLMSREETAIWVENNWNQNRMIQVDSPENPDISYWLTPQDLGLWVDADATAAAAYDIGRSYEPLLDVFSSINNQRQVIMPVLYYDESAAHQTLETIREELTLSPQNASIAFREGAWVAVPGSQGQTLNLEGTKKGLFENAFAILLDQEVALQMQTVDPAMNDLSHVLDEIESVVAQDLIFTAYDPITNESLTWSVPIETKRSWVTVDPDTHVVRLLLDQAFIQDLFIAWEQEVGDGRSLDLPDLTEIIDTWNSGQPLHTTIRHEPTTYLVSAGESLWSISLKLGMPMWNIMNANDGLTTTNLTTGMNLTIPSKNDLLPLPVIPDKRIVINISQQRMTVYENGEVRSTHIISTGVSDSPTMAGIFQVQSHEINAYASNWDLYMPHFMGIYEAWPGFMNGIHGLPLLSNGHRLWASNLGTPISYGCIILDLAAAESLYYWAEPGVVVEITK